MATVALLAAAPSIATDTWDDGAGSGLWSGSNNWADNTEPTSSDDVIFPTPIPLGASTIALSSGEQAKSITFNDNYSLGGNNLQLFGAGGDITVASGKSASISSSIIGSVGLTKGGTGTLTLSPTFSNTFTGDVAITGTLSITKDTSLGNAANTVLLGPGATTGTLQTNLSLTTLRSISPGIFGGTVSANSGTTLTINGALGGSSNPLTISGQGLVILHAASTRSGSTTIQNGTVRLDNGAGLGTSGITVGSSGTLETTGGTVSNFLSLQNTGTLRGNSSTSYAGTISVAGSSSVTLTTVNNSDTLSLSSYTGGGGSGSITNVTGSGTVLLSGANTYSGAWTIDSRLSIPSGASVSSAGSALNIIGSVSGKSGTATVTGTGATWTNSGQLHVGESGTGTLNVQSGGSVSNTEGYLAFNTGSSGTATISGTGSTWTSSGLTVGYHGTGALTIDPGGTVTSSGGSFIGFFTGSVGTATVTGPGATWNSGDLVVGDDGSGTLIIQSGGHVSSGVSLVADNAAASHGTVTVTGAGSTWANSGALYVGENGQGSLSVSAGGSVSNSDGGVGFDSNGIVTVEGPGSTWTNSGDLSVGVIGTGNLTIQSGGSVSSSSGHLGGNLLFGSGTGTVIVTGSGSNWMINGPLRVGVHGTGTLTVQSGASVSSGGNGMVNTIIGVDTDGIGMVTVTGAGSTWTNTGDVFVGGPGSGTLTISNGGTVAVSDTLHVQPTGIVKGDGNISGTVSNSGSVAPGNSPGTLHINGAYSQTSTGKLQIELAGTTPGTSYDQLLVSGAASLAGTLEVSLVGGFKPATGNAFDVMVAGSRGGTFGTSLLPDLGGRIEWNMSYTSTTATISVLATYYAGDINRDSLVDVADIAGMETALVDLSTYQATHGPGGGALTDPQLLLIANLDGNAPVTNADLQGLINLLANSGGGGSFSTVPEPPAVFLAVIALACIMARPAACVWPRQQNLSNLHQG